MKAIIKQTLLFVIFTSFLASCTKNFEELNTDKTKVSTIDNASLDFVFSAAQYRGAFVTGGFQLFESLYTDLQCQYFATTQKSFGSDRNQMVGNWLNSTWNTFYGSANPQMDVVLEYTKQGGKLEDPIKNAIAKIWKVYIFMPITDCWGPVPYSQAGNGKHEVLYDSQEDIYNDFFKSLKEATTVLNAYTGTGKFFEKGDLIYKGDVKKWLKFGNTLRLRVAMRISLKNPTLARTEAEAAVLPANGGLLISNTDNAYMVVTATTPNPLGRISAWGEFRMSAAMESVLKGYNDPRLQKFFDPALTGGAYKGIRNGMSIAQISITANGNNANSNINSAFGFDNKDKAPWTVLTASETYFLLAEGALNGWNMGGTALDFYNKGIEASFDQWGIKDATIINNYKNGTSTPIALGDIYNTPALTNIPVLFSTTEARQREQIGTQKWLALYPYSPEAWSEFKRTGFPKLYPRLNSDNLDSPAADPASVRRLTYPPVEASVNSEGLASGVAKLGGSDKSSTKVWWNK